LWPTFTPELLPEGNLSFTCPFCTTWQKAKAAQLSTAAKPGFYF
jgi:hypothetical protein